MSEISLKRQLMAQTQKLITTNSGVESIAALGEVIGTLGDLLSLWTGEVVRVRITAEGQPDKLDMVKSPPGAGAPH